MHWANFVYKFAPWADLGCWRDNKLDRAMSQLLVNLRFQIDWFNIGKTGKCSIYLVVMQAHQCSFGTIKHVNFKTCPLMRVKNAIIYLEL